LPARQRRDRQDGSIDLVAISHSAVFHEKTHVVATIENAMEEASTSRDGGVSGRYRTGAPHYTAHSDLARLSNANSVRCRWSWQALAVGSVHYPERESVDAFDARTVQLLEAVAVLLGPLIEMKADTQRLLAGRLVDNSRSGLKALFGPRRPALKLAALAWFLCCLAFSFCER